MTANMTTNLNTPPRPIKLQEMAAAAEAGNLLFSPKIELIQGVKVKLGASVGQTEISVAELFALKEGALLTLDKATDDPIELYLDGKLVALGELVVVGEHFGVKLTQIGASG